MKRYDNIVLNKLLDSYEKSTGYAAEHYTARKYDDSCKGDKMPQAANTAAHRRGVFCHIDRRSFPDYFDTASGAYETLHEQLRDLEHKGLIRLYWKGGPRGHILEKAGLEINNAEACYMYLRRTPRWKREEELYAICIRYKQKAAEISDAAGCEKYAEGISVLDSFLDWLMDSLACGERIRPFADVEDPAGLERLCRFLLAILTNDQDVYLRQFSTAVFNDSKIAEKELDRAASVIRKFGAVNDAHDSDEVISTDEIMELYGIYRNPVWIYLKGCAGFRVSNTGGGDHVDVSGRHAATAIGLPALETGIGITVRDLELLEPDPEITPECILTIENLTSYYQQNAVVNGMNALVVYIGGYAGRKKREFLKKLAEAYPDACFMHSGDIDCGGFMIWKSLCEGTGIPFETYKMDIATFDQFRYSGKPITEHDRMNLNTMEEDPFFCGQKDLFDKMLETGIKIEQESFVG